MDEARDLEARAVELCNLGRFAEAIPLLETAAALFRGGQFPFELADCLTHLATCLDALGRKRDALVMFEEALPLAREEREFANLASCLMNMANCLDQLGRHPEAYLLYLEALELDRAGDSPDDLATTLMNLANCLDLMSRHDEALPLYREALAIARQEWTASELMKCLMHATHCLMDLRQWNEALLLFQELLPLARLQGSRGHLSERLQDAAICHVGLEQWDAALALYQEAIELCRELGMMGDLSSTLMNAANCLDYLERHREAHDYYMEALPLFRSYRTPAERARFLTNMASCLDDLGFWIEAQPLHDEALAHYRDDQRSPLDMARCFQNSAKALGEQGHLEAAMALFDEALALHRANPTGEIVRCLINSASCLSKLGLKTEAATRFEEVLTLIGEHPVTPTELRRCQMGLANCKKHPEDALPLYEAALSNALANAQPGEQTTYLLNSATCLLELGRMSDALNRYEAALALARQHRRPATLALCLINTANCQLKLGHRDEARNFYAEADDILAQTGVETDHLRCILAGNRANEAQISGDLDRAWGQASIAMDLADRIASDIEDQLHRTGIRSKLRTSFQLGAWVALAHGDRRAAFSTAQRAKGRTLTELIDTRHDLTTLDRQELLLRHQHEIGAIDDEAVSRGIERIQRQRQGQSASRLGRDPRQPVDLAAIIAALRPNEALFDVLEIADDGTIIFFLLLDGRDEVALAGTIEGNRLRPLVDDWKSCRARYVRTLKRHAEMRDERLQPTLSRQLAEEQRALERLGSLLIAPILGHLNQHAITTLICSPSGLLHQLPIAALRVPDQQGNPTYLIDLFALSLVPTASTLAILRQRGAPRITWPPALLAAAPFSPADDEDFPRSFTDRHHSMMLRELVASADDRYRELPASRQEIHEIGAIIQAIDPGASAPRLLFRDATREALLAEFGSARLLHLSTHGEHLAADQSTLDFTMLLAKDDQGVHTRMTVREIYDEVIPFKDIFAICLSACHLGEVVTLGAEALGFAQAFLSAGAGVILAPIWAVEDRATARLMVGWYEHLVSGEQSTVAGAWQSAVQRMRPLYPEYSAPFFWAGFLPNGDGALRLRHS